MVGLLTVVVLTRHLGPTEFGYYRTVLTYCAFAAVLGGLWSLHGDPAGDVAGGSRCGPRAGNALPLRVVSTGSVLLAAAAVAWLTPYDSPVKWGMLIGAAIYTCLQASDFLISILPERPQAGAQRRRGGHGRRGDPGGGFRTGAHPCRRAADARRDPVGCRPRPGDLLPAGAAAGAVPAELRSAAVAAVSDRGSADCRARRSSAWRCCAATRCCCRSFSRRRRSASMACPRSSSRSRPRFLTSWRDS